MPGPPYHQPVQAASVSAFTGVWDPGSLLSGSWVLGHETRTGGRSLLLRSVCSELCSLDICLPILASEAIPRPTMVAPQGSKQPPRATG